MFKRIVLALVVLCLAILLVPLFLDSEDSENHQTISIGSREDYKKEQQTIHKRTNLIIDNIDLD